jgi:hypothetical protein
MKVFEVRKDRLDQTRMEQRDFPPVGDGEVLLAVDRFAFTANNITYAVFGEAMHYWDFFPTGEEGWGVVPVWGFADVVASRCEGIERGERFYGYYPMASHLKVRPGRVGKSGFTDVTAHRRELPEVYNRYTRTSADPAYRKELEAQQMLYRPLFMTSFLLDDFLAEEDFFGAKEVVLTSASSKTAFGLAFLLHHHRKPGIEVRGLTSASNTDFVNGLGCYDTVHTYDDVAELPPDHPTLLVDFAGNTELRREVHEHYGEALTYSCSVGASHWEQAAGGGDLPGPTPTLFFAPSWVEKRMSDWGPGGIEQRVGAAWQSFLQESADWLEIREDSGDASVERVYRKTLAGDMPPRVGQILVMG